MTAPFIFYPEDYGTIAGDGSTNDSAAINAAIQACGDAGGGEVHCLSPVYGIGSTVLVNRHNVYLRGRGRSWLSYRFAEGPLTHFEPLGGTVFKAKAGLPALTPMTLFKNIHDPVHGHRLSGAGIGGIAHDGNLIADYGIKIEGAAGGRFDDLIADNTKAVGIWLDVAAPGSLPVKGVNGAAYDEPRSMQWCNFDLLSSSVWESPNQSACWLNVGLLINGDSEHNVCFCKFSRISIAHMNNAGMKVGSSDFCRFDQVAIGRWPSSNGAWKSLYFMKGSGSADFPRQHHIGFVQLGAGAGIAGSGALAPDDISITRWSLGNGSPAPGTIPGVTVLNVQ